MDQTLTLSDAALDAIDRAAQQATPTESTGGLTHEWALAHEYFMTLCAPERIRALVAEVRRHRWQPIATAPKDGTEVLAWFGHRGVYRARWDDDKHARNPRPLWTSYAWLWGVRDLRENQPTHWQPLPAAPVPDPPKET